MRFTLLSICTLALQLAACGGGDGSPPAPPSDGGNGNPITVPGVAMEIRYAPEASGGALTIQGPDSSAISNVAVNRVEVRVANGPVQALTAPNASTAVGVNAYRFVTPAFAADRSPVSAADQSCYTPVPVTVTVLFGPASSLVRHLAFCPLVAQSWFASSSETVAGVFSLSASAAAFGEASVQPFQPPAAEQFVFASTTAESGTLHGDFLPHILGSQVRREAYVRARVGYRQPQGAFQPDVPIPGTILAARLNRSLGTTAFGVLLDTFAESHVAVDTATAQEAFAVHPTCELDGAITGATPATQLMRVAVGAVQAAPTTRRWNYSLQLVHPTNDVVIAQAVGSSTAAQMAWTVPGIPGARLRADVAPADANLGIVVEVASVPWSIPSGLPAFVEMVPVPAGADLALGQFYATANSNRAGVPARLNFFLCR